MRGVPGLCNTLDSHDERLCHDCSITTIQRYGCFITHQELLVLAQLVEHKALNLVVVGLSPTVGANVGDLFSNAKS
jgi:hypothetical protein